MPRDEALTVAAIVAGAVFGALYAAGRRHRAERWRLLRRVNTLSQQLDAAERERDTLLALIRPDQPST